MKIFRRLTALLSAAILCISAGNIPVFAAEGTNDNAVLANMENVETVTNEDGSTEVSFDLVPTSIPAESGITPYANIDQSFTMTSIHTGSTRTYNQNSLSYLVSFTDANGNLLSDGTILAVRLCTPSQGIIREDQYSGIAGGSANIPITYGGRYYFQYAVAYGTQTIRVRMRIS